jgi:ketosteroid isomerase-like protein
MAKATPPDTQVVLDKDAIKEMVYKNYYPLDEGNVADFMEMFTEDATFDAGPFGSAEGKAAITEMIETLFDEEILFSRHMLHNPVVEVDGDEASGTWYLEMPMISGEGEALWLQGTYEHEFRRVDGEWKVSTFTFEPTYLTPYDEGWAEQPFPEGMPGELDW